MSISINFKFSGESISPKDRHFLSFSDGDSISIQQPVRLVSCDTPEKAQYAGGPDISQPKLDKCKDRLSCNFYKDIPLELREYLINKLEKTTASNHIEAAEKASSEFQKMLQNRLEYDSDEENYGRKLGIIPTQPFMDKNNRLLGYLVPWYKGKKKGDPLPPLGDPKRRTFNVDMIRDGWAAPFVIYPSIPSKKNLKILLDDAESAWKDKQGVWELYGEDFLLAYEYRMCIKLAEAKTAKKGIETAFQRICFDIRDMSEKGLFGFGEVDPCYRIWAWKTDIEQARVDLGIQS